MKISVITACYNSEATIRETIKSVLSQTGADLEYLVVDGRSTDRTLEKLKPFRDRIDLVISEPDRGMYDAMNKGVARATGDIIAILNSDDIYADSTVLEAAVACFEKNKTEVVYGDLHYVAQDDLEKTVRDWKSGDYRDGLFKSGWHPPHPSFFVRRSVYEEFGGFNLELRIAADFEFMLRVLYKHKCSVVYLPEVLVKMRMGGTSNRSIANIIKANCECYRAWRINGYGWATAVGATVLKPLRKCSQLRSGAQ